MKTNRFLWHMMYSCIIAVFMVFICACDGDEPLPIPDKIEGEVTFVVDDNNGTGGNSGIGTPDNPAQVSQGETLSMVVSQESSYTDPNGNVYTCEPKATIEVFSVEEKVYAKDIKALTTISGNVEVTTSQSGTNPVTKTTTQKFKIGGQEVVFDLGYEVFTYVNSYSQSIEMPYIKVNQAKFGTGDATEVGTNSSQSAISLKSLSLTRASVTESTEFEVTAKFSLELQSVNTKQEQTQSLEFEVKYIGVVEEITELYGNVSYDINGGSATSFSLDGGKELSLVINQTSTYAKEGEAVYTYEPKAKIKLKASKATVEASNPELFEEISQKGDVTSKVEGKNPLTYNILKSFTSQGQVFDFEASYEVYTSNDGDEMPYLKIGEPKCVGIEVKEADATRAVETTYYDVKAKFEVDVIGVNVTDPINETLSFEVTYKGSVSVVKDDPVELVKIEYRKNAIYTPPHDNILPSCQTIVYRDRYYSDGNVETDTFAGPNCLWFGRCPTIMSKTRVTEVDSLVKFNSNYEVYYRTYTKNDNDGINNYATGSCVVPDLDELELWEADANKENFVGFVDGYDSRYQMDFSNVKFNPDAPQDGWYMCNIYESKVYTVTCQRAGYNIVRRYEMSFTYMDRFLYVDDTAIGFPECRVSYDNGGPVLSQKDIPGTSEYGPGRVYRVDLSGEILGQKFHYFIADTLYTFKR